MSEAIMNKRTFTAHLYLEGRPVVLNQQRLQQALRNPRITRSEKLDAEVGLADTRTPSFITLADDEDDEPLELKFVPHGNFYAINLVLPGKFNGASFFIEDKTHNLLVSTSTRYFSISTYGALQASLNDIEAGPAYVGLNAEPSGQPLYHYLSSGMSTFVDVDPNGTGHNAFNNRPASFVIKVLE